MIISHKNKFIFIKTKKTAGTSIEISLSGICGTEDIITPITKKDEILRKELGYRGAQNYISDTHEFYNHIDAQSVRDCIGKNIWNDYYKFCFERNPWDKVVSWYFWVINHGKNMTFEEYMISNYFTQVGGPGGIDLYTGNTGEIILDKVYLYEDLDKSLIDISKRIKVDSIPKLPYAKSEFRIDKSSYKNHFTDKTKILVSNNFSREIKLFNYIF